MAAEPEPPIEWVDNPGLDDFLCGVEYVVQVSTASFKSMVVAKTRGQDGTTWVRFGNDVVISDVDTQNDDGISITRDLRAWEQ